MDVSQIATVISTVGFPIAACVGLFYLYDKTIKDLTVTLAEVAKTLENINARHDEKEI